MSNQTDALNKLYDALRDFDPKKKVSDEAAAFIAEKLGANAPVGDLHTHIQILAKLARQTDRATFANVIAARDLPPIALTPREMEFVQGGGFSDASYMNIGPGWDFNFMEVVALEVNYVLSW